VLVKTGIRLMETKTDALSKKTVDEPHSLALPDSFGTAACPGFGMQSVGYTLASADYMDPLGEPPSGYLGHICLVGHSRWRYDGV
jgi:hypothetical protein